MTLRLLVEAPCRCSGRGFCKRCGGRGWESTYLQTDDLTRLLAASPIFKEEVRIAVHDPLEGYEWTFRRPRWELLSPEGEAVSYFIDDFLPDDSEVQKSARHFSQRRRVEADVLEMRARES